jgi:hypothetical protein
MRNNRNGASGYFRRQMGNNLNIACTTQDEPTLGRER